MSLISFFSLVSINILQVLNFLNAHVSNDKKNSNLRGVIIYESELTYFECLSDQCPIGPLKFMY
jgi:hypothetical protein